MQNPYLSPAPTNEHPPGVRGRTLPDAGIATRTIFGIWAGVLFGGTFGAGGSAVLALARAATVGWFAIERGWATIEDLVMAEVAAVIAGAICGLCAGALIGPAVALVTGFVPLGRHRWPLATAVVLSTAAGGAWGAVGGSMLSVPDATTDMARVLGITIGALAGMLGGLQLGRGIMAFAFTGESATGGIDDCR